MITPLSARAMKMRSRLAGKLAAKPMRNGALLLALVAVLLVLAGCSTKPVQDQPIEKGPHPDQLLGLYPAYDNEAFSWGFINSSGDWMIEPAFPLVGLFNDGLAVALDPASGLFGFIDSSGQWAIEPRFLWVTDFYEGLSAAQDPDSNLIGYINTQGEWAIEPRFFYGRFFYGEYALINDNDGSPYPVCYIINQQGQVVYQAPERWEIYPSLADGMATVTYMSVPSSDGFEMRILDIASGEIIYSINAPYIFPKSSFSEGLAFVYDPESRLCGIIDRSGAWMVEPRYTETTIFLDGLAYVHDEKAGLSGFIDKSFNWVGQTYPGHLEGSMSGAWIGQEPYTKDYFMHDGLIFAKDSESGLWGVIDLHDNWYIEPTYDYATINGIYMPFYQLFDYRVYHFDYLKPYPNLYLPLHIWRAGYRC